MDGRAPSISLFKGECEDMSPVTQVTHQNASTRPVTPGQALDTPTQVYKGPVTRSRAKLLQKEVNSLLAEINFDIFENVILPKCSTLVVLRHTNKEEDVTLHCTSTKKTDHQFGPVQ